MNQYEEKEIFGHLKMTCYLVTVIYVVLTIAIAIAYGLGMQAPVAGKETVYILNTLLILVAIASIPAGYYFYGNKSKEITGMTDENMKLAGYRKAVLLRFLFFDFAGFSGLAVYFTTKSQQAMYFILIVIILFLINIPSKDKYQSEFGGKGEETEE